MQVVIDEARQRHIYICLVLGGGDFSKQLKGATPLGLSTTEIEGALELNRELRAMFNPMAEDEARSKARRGDGGQLDLEDEIGSSGETGGRRREEVHIGASVGSIEDGEEIPPNDEVLRDNLIFCGDRHVLLSDIRGWTSSEREAAIRFATDYNRFEDDLETAVPVHVALVAMTLERIGALLRAGPYVMRGLPVGAEDTTSTLILLPATDDTEEKVEGEYVDDAEAMVRCARLNRDAIRNDPMSNEHVAPWAAAGPWKVKHIFHLEKDVPDAAGEHQYYAENDFEGVMERVSSGQMAIDIVARYNRIARPLADREIPPPPAVTDAAMGA